MKNEFNVAEEYYFARIEIAHEIKDKLLVMDKNTRKKELGKLDPEMAGLVNKLMSNRLN